MSKPIRMFFISAIIVVFTSVAMAHGKKEHSEAIQSDYDPIENEFGSYDPGLKPDRVIEVSMGDDMRFSPDKITVSENEIIEFIVANDGKLMHEFVLGTSDSLQEHAEMMKKFPGMEHEEPYMAHVEPGGEMKIIWQFSKGGEFEFACLIPGHFDAGMRGILDVQ